MWFFLLFLIPFAWAFPVLHLIKPESSFTQITTLEACTTYLNTSDLVSCNPALFPFQNQEGLRMGLSTITDGESVEVGQKLLFDPISKEFLEELFEKRAFNSWGANSHIEFRTSKFYLTYNPLLINADVYVFNPASPEVAMSLVKSNRLQVSSGLKLIDTDSVILSLGTKIYYYRSEYFQDSFFLSDLSSEDIEKLIKLKNRSGVAGDIAAFMDFPDTYLPKISVVLKNLNSQYKNTEKDILAENQMRPLLVYETYSRLGLGYSYKQKWGVINSEVNFAFRELFQDYYNEYLVASIGYSLTRFSTNLSYSKYQQVFGFNFGSKLANIGIFYGKSRPLGDFSAQEENVGGIRAEISL